MKLGKRNQRIKFKRNLSLHEKQMHRWANLMVLGALVGFAALFYLVNRWLIKMP